MTSKRASRHAEVKPSKFKTSTCQYFLKGEECPFGDRCSFAHGDHELHTEEVNVLLLRASGLQRLDGIDAQAAMLQYVSDSALAAVSLAEEQEKEKAPITRSRSITVRVRLGGPSAQSTASPYDNNAAQAKRNLPRLTVQAPQPHEPAAKGPACPSLHPHARSRCCATCGMHSTCRRGARVPYSHNPYDTSNMLILDSTANCWRPPKRQLFHYGADMSFELRVGQHSSTTNRRGIERVHQTTIKEVKLKICLNSHSFTAVESIGNATLSGTLQPHPALLLQKNMRQRSDISNEKLKAMHVHPTELHPLPLLLVLQPYSKPSTSCSCYLFISGLLPLSSSFVLSSRHFYVSSAMRETFHIFFCVISIPRTMCYTHGNGGTVEQGNLFHAAAHRKKKKKKKRLCFSSEGKEKKRKEKKRKEKELLMEDNELFVFTRPTPLAAGCLPTVSLSAATPYDKRECNETEGICFLFEVAVTFSSPTTPTTIPIEEDAFIYTPRIHPATRVPAIALIPLATKSPQKKEEEDTLNEPHLFTSLYSIYTIYLYTIYIYIYTLICLSLFFCFDTVSQTIMQCNGEPRTSAASSLRPVWVSLTTYDLIRTVAGLVLVIPPHSSLLFLFLIKTFTHSFTHSFTHATIPEERSYFHG
eukprot:gene1017-607_t